MTGNLWITVVDGKYWATDDERCWYCGGFPRVLRCLTKLLKTGETTPSKIVFPTLRELKRFTRVESDEQTTLVTELQHQLASLEVLATVVPGLSERFPWVTERVPLVKKKPGSGVKTEDHRIPVYVDGSCLGNPGFGGWGFYSRHGSRSGSALDVTNNAMELDAAIYALRWFRKHKPGVALKIVSDSRYVVTGATTWRHRWATNGYTGVANADRWRALAKEIALAHDVAFTWVKGHNGHPGNTKADALAGAAARALRDASR